MAKIFTSYDINSHDYLIFREGEKPYVGSMLTMVDETTKKRTTTYSYYSLEEYLEESYPFLPDTQQAAFNQAKPIIEYWSAFNAD